MSNQEEKSNIESVEEESFNKTLDSVRKIMVEARDQMKSRDRKKVFDLMNSGVSDAIHNSKSDLPKLATMSDSDIDEHLQKMKDAQGNMHQLTLAFESTFKLLEGVIGIIL